MILLNPAAYRAGMPVVVNTWSRMMQLLVSRMEIAKGRFLISEQRATTLIQFVRSLIDPIDNPALLNVVEDFDLYIQHVLPESITLTRIIDPIIRPYRTKNIFVTQDSIDELILPTYGMYNNILTPRGDWKDWSTVDPIHILSYDSTELVTPNVDGRLTFTRNKPSYIAVGVDVPSLVMKFIHYIRHTGTTMEHVDRDLFIARHILPVLYDDVLHVWCVNLLDYYIRNRSDLDMSTVVTTLANNNSHLTSSTIKDALEELGGVLDRIHNNGWAIGTLLTTKLIGTETLADQMHMHTTVANIDDSTRYLGYNLLKSSSLIKCLLSVLERTQTVHVYSELIRRIIVEGGRISRSGWRAHVRERVEIEEITEMLDRMSKLLIR